MKNLFRLLILGVFLLSGCNKSKFVPDPTDDLLPVYSESGRNIAGALINDTAWRCELNSCFACEIWRFYINSYLTGDSTTFNFNGLYTSNSVNFIDKSIYNVPINLYVIIKGLKIENQDSLLKLNNRTFLLDSANSYSSISRLYQSPTNKGFGSFTVNKVRKESFSIGDGTPNNPKNYTFIVSGHFNFTIHGDRDYIIKNGRFDMEVLSNTTFGIEQ